VKGITPPIRNGPDNDSWVFVLDLFECINDMRKYIAFRGMMTSHFPFRQDGLNKLSDTAFFAHL
jgi:hypothetical protein